MQPQEGAANMQQQTCETNSQPRAARSGVPQRLAWLLPRTSRQRFVFRSVGTALLLGVTLAYEPALGEGSGPLVGIIGNPANTHPLPYTPIIAGAGIYGSTVGAGAFVGVWGNTSTLYPGVYGTNQGGGPGVEGISGTDGTTGGAFGVYGLSYGSNSNGQLSAAGVYGLSITTTGVAGVSGSSGDPAIYGYNSNTGTGVWGQSANGYGVYGYMERPEAAGVFGTNARGGAGVIGLGNSTTSPTGYFRNDTGGSSGVSLQGQCNAGAGVVGIGSTGVYGSTTAQNGNAGYFNGNIQVTGTVSGAAKHFKIDHPLDPAHKYLVHASVESSEMLYIYRGNVFLDSDGKATVQMPDWFQSENGDCSYNLTCVGGYAPVYVAKELEHNQFEIAGGKPGLKVSWQLNGNAAGRLRQTPPAAGGTGKERAGRRQIPRPGGFWQAPFGRHWSTDGDWQTANIDCFPPADAHNHAKPAPYGNVSQATHCACLAS